MMISCVSCGRKYEIDTGEKPSNFQCTCGGNLKPQKKRKGSNDELFTQLTSLWYTFNKKLSVKDKKDILSEFNLTGSSGFIVALIIGLILAFIFNYIFYGLLAPRNITIFSIIIGIIFVYLHNTNMKMSLIGGVILGVGGFMIESVLNPIWVFTTQYLSPSSVIFYQTLFLISFIICALIGVILGKYMIKKEILPPIAKSV